MEHIADSTGWPRAGEPQRRQGLSEPGQCVDSGTELTVTDLAEIVDLLKRKLAWFGLHSVRIGPYVKVHNGAVLIDLLEGGDPCCRVVLNRRSGAVAFPNGSALRRLMASLHKDVCRHAEQKAQ